MSFALFAFISVVIGLVTSLGVATSADAASDGDDVVVEVFWGDGCGFCERLLDHLDELATRQPGFVVETYEVWYDADNLRYLQRRGAELGVSVEAVPFTIVAGEDSWLGFSPTIARQIDAAIAARVDTPTTGDPTTPGTPVPPPDGDEVIVDVPLVGAVDVEGRSLVLTTALIAFVDGFNPCSLWVLTVLLALVLHTGSRRRVAMIGGSFLVVTTLVYGLFLVGIYGALTFVSALGWIRVAVAAFALVFGLVNVKDYLWFRVGPSFTIADQHKPGIIRRARGLIRPGMSLPAAMAGAAAMAVGVSLIEIPCTAGFPVIWSDRLSAAGVSGAMFALLLGLYLLIYLVDELLVFGAAVVTMRVTKLQEHHGRALKLVGGMVMIAIAVTILVDPGIMDTPTGVLVVFGIALAASAAVAGIDRVLRVTGRDDDGPPTSAPPPDARRAVSSGRPRSG